MSVYVTNLRISYSNLYEIDNGIEANSCIITDANFQNKLIKRFEVVEIKEPEKRLVFRPINFRKTFVAKLQKIGF